MICFVKSFATYRTIKQANVMSHALTLDSLEADTSTVTVAGTDIGRADIGSWLIIDGLVFLISAVKPRTDRTLLTLLSPLQAFSRVLEFRTGYAMTSIGDFIADVMTREWRDGLDPVYAIPYLRASSTDDSPFSVPDFDDSGCYNFADYVLLMRKAYRVRCAFTDGGRTLDCTISRQPTESHQISFTDGHSQLQTLDFASSGIAKLTVLNDIDTGEQTPDGAAIITRSRQDWYLSEDGDISLSIPARRASGEWGMLHISGADDVYPKIAEAFARNKSDHKLEFWSDRDLPVHSNCSFFLYGEPLHSYIAYKRRSSNDTRFYYKCGELKTTLTDRLKGGY